MNTIGLNINLFIRIIVDTKQIKANSSTLLILNYLGMRKRMGKAWATDLEIAQFFPHKLQKRSKQAADARQALDNLLKAKYVVKKKVKNVDYYSSTELGSRVPYIVANRLASSPTYQSKTKHQDKD
jgi:hypothetical protein